MYEFVQKSLEPEADGDSAWKQPVLLVDDLSVLLSLGMGAVAVLDFIHYCRASVCRQLKVCTPAPVRDSSVLAVSSSPHTQG